MTQARALRTLLAVQVRLYLREPVGVFFTLLLAPLMLLFMGLIFGNEPLPMFGGHGQLDVYVPVYAALVIAVVALMSVPIETSGRREAGVLRRFRATPLRPLTYMVADVLVYFAMTLLGIVLLLLVGRFVFHVTFQGNLFAWMAAVGLGSSAFLAFGYLLAALAPNPRVATIVGNVVLFPMAFFSGTTMPLELMPESVRHVSRYLPLTSVATLLRGLWSGAPVGDFLFEIGMLAAVLVVSTLLAVRLFRWE